MWSTLKSWDKEGYSIACGSRGNYQATTVSVVNEVAVGGVGSRVLMFVEELIFERIQIQGLMLQVLVASRTIGRGSSRGMPTLCCGQWRYRCCVKGRA